MGRLISGSAALGQYKYAFPQLCGDFSAYVVPVISAQSVFVFADLRRTSHVHDDTSQPRIPVPGVYQVYAVVFKSFDMTKLHVIGISVHPRFPRKLGLKPLVSCYAMRRSITNSPCL